MGPPLNPVFISSINPVCVSSINPVCVSHLFQMLVMLILMLILLLMLIVGDSSELSDDDIDWSEKSVVDLGDPSAPQLSLP